MLWRRDPIPSNGVVGAGRWQQRHWDSAPLLEVTATLEVGPDATVRDIGGGCRCRPHDSNTSGDPNAAIGAETPVRVKEDLLQRPQ